MIHSVAPPKVSNFRVRFRDYIWNRKLLCQIFWMGDAGGGATSLWRQPHSPPIRGLTVPPYADGANIQPVMMKALGQHCHALQSLSLRGNDFPDEGVGLFRLPVIRRSDQITLPPIRFEWPVVSHPYLGLTPCPPPLLWLLFFFLKKWWLTGGEGFAKKNRALKVPKFFWLFL